VEAMTCFDRLEQTLSKLVFIVWDRSGVDWFRSSSRTGLHNNNTPACHTMLEGNYVALTQQYNKHEPCQHKEESNSHAT